MPILTKSEVFNALDNRFNSTADAGDFEMLYEPPVVNETVCLWVSEWVEEFNANHRAFECTDADERGTWFLLTFEMTMEIGYRSGETDDAEVEY
jgi:hypothetical protein